MKKRLMALVLITTMLMAGVLSACSSKESDKDTKDTSKTAQEKTVQKNHSSEKKKVVLNEVAHSIFYAPMYIAIEEGYFAEEGIDLELVTGFGADKTMTAVLSGNADIGFMGSEASIYTYNEGANDYVVNFAQLTQRAGNFLVAREKIDDFSWENLKGKEVLGGRKGGMPEMVFEYILKQHKIDPEKDLTINQNIDFGSTAAAFSEGQADFTVEFEPGATNLEQEGKGYAVSYTHLDVYKRQGIRSKILRFILHHLPRHHNPRKWFIHSYLYKWICFIVHQHRIIFRTMLFNQITFQYKRFQL